MLVDDDDSSNGFFSKKTIVVFTIFLFLGLLTLNFVNSEPISIKYDSNLKISDLTYKQDYSGIKDAIDSKVSKKNSDKVKKSFDHMIFFNVNNLTLDLPGDRFAIDIKDYIHNLYSSSNFVLRRIDQTNLVCSVNNTLLSCITKEDFIGRGSVKLELQDKVLGQKDYLIINVNVYQNPEFDLNNISFDVNEDSVFQKDLNEYISNFNKNYSLELVRDISNGDCSVNNTLLKCNFKKDYFGLDNLELKLKDLNSSLKIDLNVLNVNDEPIINPIFLEAGKIKEELLVNEEQTYNLLDYVIDPDMPKDYIAKLNSVYFVSLPAAEDTCRINLLNYELTCKFKQVGVYTVSIAIIDSTYNLFLPFEFTVKPLPYVNQAPKYIGNLDKGITSFANSYELKSINSFFNDPENEQLDFNIEKLTGDLTSSCSSVSGNYDCVFSGEGYGDFIFTATDSNNAKAESSVYRVALINEGDIGIVYPSTSYRVISNQVFDFDLSLRNNLAYDLYNLDFELQNTFDANLKARYDLLLANETKTLTYNITTPNDANVQEYILTPTINPNNTFTITSIPYTAEALKEYFSVVGNKPSDKIPGFIFGIQYRIDSTFDVPVNIYVCQVAIESVPNSQVLELYKEEGVNYNLVPENYFCEYKQIDKTLEFYSYVKNNNTQTMVSSVFLSEQNIQYIPLLEYSDFLSSGFILDSDYLRFIPDPSYLTEYARSEVLSPNSQTPLVKNNIYDINLKFKNDYDYPIVNVPVCIKTYYTNDWINIDYNFKNEYYEVLTKDCSNVNIDSKGFIEKTFSFKPLQSRTRLTLPYYGLSTGYVLDNNYYAKDGVDYTIQ